MAMTQPSSITEMVAQSRAIITSPGVPTFNRYEKRGSLGNAIAYVLVGAVIVGILGAITALVTLSNPLTAFLGGVLQALITFVLFTGLVFYVGRGLGAGSGTWDEVAYSFALFTVPLSVIGGALALVITLLGWIPILGGLIALAGGLASLVVLLAQVYFAFLAVQSSMNITDPGRALLTLVLAFVGTGAGLFVLTLLQGFLPLLIGIAVVVAVLFGLGIIGKPAVRR